LRDRRGAAYVGARLSMALVTPQPADSPSHRTMEAAAQWYALLVSGEATPRDEARWHAWLDAHPTHRAAWAYVEQVSQRVLAPLRKTPDPRLTADNLHAANQRVWRRRRALAGLASVAGGGLLAWLSWRATPLGGWVQAWTADYRTAVGEIRDLRLPDGTHAWLNTASAIDVDYSSALRRLRLVAGEIYIDTAADARRPFVVDTAHGRLRALGTQFTVYQQADGTLLTVFQGAVEIRSSGDALPVVIPAGRQARFDAQRVYAVSQADPARQAWRRGDLVALDMTLAQVVAELRRYTNGHLGLADSLAQRRVFGTFPLRDVDATLVLLADAAGLRVKRSLPWWTTLEPA